MVTSLRRIQLDPTNVVARSHEIVLWSRLGSWDRAELTRLIETERRLVEYDAFIVPTEHWPIIAAAARQAPIGDTKRARDSREWIRDNKVLRRHILDTIEDSGVVPTSAFEDLATRSWKSSGWSDAKNVSRMLELLARRGDLIRAGRHGTERLWELPERWLTLPARKEVPPSEALVAAISHEIRAKGVAQMPQRSPYSAAPWPFGGLPTRDVITACRQLVDKGVLLPATVEGMRGDWFIHSDHLATLETVDHDLPSAVTTLLSPFDSLITDRDALEDLWGFKYRLEIYVPRPRREWGYFVLPILHGERPIGRVDPQLDRVTSALVVNRIYAEPDAPFDAATAAAIGRSLADLAKFVGATTLDVKRPIPRGWTTGISQYGTIATKNV